MKNLKFLLLTLPTVLIIGFSFWQYKLARKSYPSCGGDFSYWVKCPLGTYCGSIAKDPLRCPLCGGYCKPWLTAIFRGLENQMGQDETPPTTETPASTPGTTSETEPVVVATKIPPIEPAEGLDDWQTFTNENYGYQIKYPADWVETSSIKRGEENPPTPDGGEGGLKGFQVYLLKHPDKILENGPTKMPFLDISVSSDVGEWGMDNHLRMFEHMGGFGAKLMESTLQGHKVLIYNKSSYYWVKIFRGNDIYDLRWYEDSPDDPGLFMQILSTFRFLDKDE